MMYATTCSCGDEMKVEADSKEDAMTKLKAMMTPDMVAKHMAEKHKGMAPPSPEDMAKMMSQIHPITS